MRAETIMADRLTAFSDAVFALIVTVMALELKAPDLSAFSALWHLWPTAISDAVRGSGSRLSLIGVRDFQDRTRRSLLKPLLL